MNNKRRTETGKFEEVFGHFDFHQLYDFIAESCQNNDILVEVGCAFGKSLMYLMEKLKIHNKNVNLYGVDIFKQFDDINNIDFPFGLNGKQYREICNDETLYYDFLYNISNSIAKSIKPTNIRTDSTNASLLFNDNSIFFVFIDADHSYEKVLLDLKAWWPKLKINGYLCGHDFVDKNENVGRAVEEFCKLNNVIYKLSGTSFVINK
jgi:cephalosporin hydroxylase